MTKFQSSNHRYWFRMMVNWRRSVTKLRLMMDNFMVHGYWWRSISRFSSSSKMHEGLNNRSRSIMGMRYFVFMVGHRSMRDRIIMMGHRCMGNLIVVMMRYLVFMVRNGQMRTMMINMYFMMRCISCRVMNWRRSISRLGMSMMINMVVIFVMRIWRWGRNVWERCRHVMRHR